MRIQGDGHQHNHLRRLACLFACYDGPAFTRLSLCRSSLGVVLGDLVDVACVSNKTVISIIMYVDRALDFCGCVAVIGLGDLVTWRHFVRASRGQLSVLL